MKKMIMVDGLSGYPVGVMIEDIKLVRVTSTGDNSIITEIELKPKGVIRCTTVVPKVIDMINGKDE